jgi:DNA-binding MarR family transcriptional regulator
MAASGSKSGSTDFFGSFLEAADTADGNSAANPSREKVAEKAIINQLVSLSEPISLKELIARTDLPPSLVVSALHRLADANLVQLREAEKDELVELSDLGRKIGAVA